MGSDHYYDHHESEDLGTPGPFRDQEFARSNQPSPLPVDSSFPMQQRFRGAYDVPGSNRGSLAPSSTFSAGLADSERANSPLMKEGYSDNPHAQRSSTDLPYPPDRYNTTTAPTRSRFRTLLLIGLGVFILIILAVIIPVYFTVIKPKADNLGAIGGSSSGGSSTASASKPSQTNVITGGDGSTITTETGETFVYHNQFGGYWIDDPNNPFNDGAQAQSYATPLNQTWRYGIDPIRGVNLGGWLVCEPFITPALYEPYFNAGISVPDEWGLSLAMDNDKANGGLATLMENHYKTFITEEDFAQIAAAGLNWVRIPLGFWAIEVRNNEPFLEGVSWKYFLKAIKWARKYGIRINLDLHSVPGSQNGYNHSGKLGSINFMNGVMGLANAQRALEYMRIITEFISQPEYTNVIPMFSILNEPWLNTLGLDNMGHFYLQAYNMIRNITGIGEGNGPVIAMHDGFAGLGSYKDWLPGIDRFFLDSHPYFAFSPQISDPISSQTGRPCTTWADSFNGSMANFGFTSAGEWSLAINDCGYWLNGIGSGSRFDGTWQNKGGGVGSCAPWNDWETWSQDTKSDFQQVALSSMDALQNWFFWTWKIGNTTTTGSVGSPMWSYQLGLQEGWMPTDPQKSTGQCSNFGTFEQFDGPLKAWQTGGAGAGQINPASSAAWAQWPAPTIPNAGDAAQLPIYTATGAVPTLPPPTFTASVSINAGNGWFDPSDTGLAPASIQGCPYPDSWNAVGVAVPQVPACTQGTFQKREANPMPAVTAAP